MSHFIRERESEREKERERERERQGKARQKAKGKTRPSFVSNETYRYDAMKNISFGITPVLVSTTQERSRMSLDPSLLTHSVDRS